VAQSIANTSGWQERLQLELAPAHGRMAGALRTAVSAAMAAAVLLYLQIPMIAPGIYLIFLVSYDVPYLTFKRSVQELASQIFGVVLALSLVIVTDNDPMARVLGIAAFTFLSAYLLHACTVRVMAMNLGIFPVLTLSLWEMHRPPGQLVYFSFAPVLTGALAVGCKIALEYLFTHRDPYRALQLELRQRLLAVQQLFEAFAAETVLETRSTAMREVARFAFAGQGRMAALVLELRTAPQREAAPGDLPPALVPMIARFLELAASIGRRNHGEIPCDQRPCFRILAQRLQELLQGRYTEAMQPRICAASKADLTLLQIERDLDNIVSAVQIDSPALPKMTVVDPEDKSWFRADALSNPEYILYASKLSLSATLCYVLYNAMGWPGISTATLTVLVAGLSTSGATNQKMVFRLIGGLLGGVLCGLGCQIFVYPNAATELPFLLSVFAVSFLAAWIARGAHLGYVGLQIAFSFYLVVFQEYMAPLTGGSEFVRSAMPIHGFTAPLSLTQGRDRVIGILLALVVMWIVFHRLHPRRSIERMHQGLAKLLGISALQIRVLLERNAVRDAQLRAQANQVVLEIRTLAEAIPYELDQEVENDRARAETIQEAIMHAGSLFLHLNALSQSSVPASLYSDSFSALADELWDLAQAINEEDGEKAIREESAAARLTHEVNDSSMQNARAAYLSLRRLCAAVAAKEIPVVEATDEAV
jgi:multidrug resistance protein MdtO